MDVPGDKLPSVASGALAAYLRDTTAPQVPHQLRAAFLAAIDAGRLRSMLNKQMTLKPLHRPGALLLGDAFNMRSAARPYLVHLYRLATLVVTCSILNVS